ncbi:restin homolog isoform X2 [Mytilus trossulus]|uniref:restin homolog isoform X2 n=1 Tax=Mytilus trossulus TaxID=6551 RepID=UPI003005F967
MNKYVVGTTKNPARLRQRRAIQMAPLERLQQKKKVSFKMRECVMEDIHVVEECREMFRKEIYVLGQEILKFREMCEKELQKYKIRIQKELHQSMADADIEQARKDGTETPVKAPDIETKDEMNGVLHKDPTAVTKMWHDKLNSLQEDMDILAKRQSQIDRENVLADQEESLSERKTELENYEKEMDEIESGLDRRQEMCQKRQKDLLSLDEELDRLKQELEKKKEGLDLLGVDSSELKNRDRRNWEHVRNNLLQKQSFLQKKVDQYRTELATLKASCTAKDISISKLQYQVTELKDTVAERDAKIEKLNTQLSFMIEEANIKERKTKPLPRQNSFAKMFNKQKSIQRQNSFESEDRDKVSSSLPKNINSTRTSVKHPMRRSIDVTNSANGFQMGIKPPSADESRACIVM